MAQAASTIPQTPTQNVGRISLVAPLSRANVILVLILSLLFGLISLVYLLETSGVATIGYDIQRLQVEKKQWELKNEQLQLEMAKMQSLVWVEARAAQLGMERPEKSITVQVDRPQGGDHGR